MVEVKRSSPPPFLSLFTKDQFAFFHEWIALSLFRSQKTSDSLEKPIIEFPTLNSNFLLLTSFLLPILNHYSFPFLIIPSSHYFSFLLPIHYHSSFLFLIIHLSHSLSFLLPFPYHSSFPFLIISPSHSSSFLLSIPYRSSFPLLIIPPSHSLSFLSFLINPPSHSLPSPSFNSIVPFARVGLAGTPLVLLMGYFHCTVYSRVEQGIFLY